MKAKRVSKVTFKAYGEDHEKVVVKRERTFSIVPRTVYDIKSSNANVNPMGMSSFGFGRTHATCDTLEDAREAMRLFAKDSE